MKKSILVLLVLLLLPVASLVQAAPYNEESRLYAYEQEYATRLLPVMRKLGVDRLEKAPTRMGRDKALPHEWALGWKRHGSKRHRTRVTFKAIDYSDSDPIEGTPVVYDLPDEGRGWSQIYRPQAIPIDQLVDESIELNEEVYENYRVEASFSVTNRTSVKAEAKVGPVGASAESETTVSASAGFGLDRGTRTVTKYIHKVSTTVHIPVGQAVMVTVDVSKRKVVTPITERGLIEAEVMWNLSDWAEKHAKYLRDGKDAKRNRIYFDTFQDLLWFLEGQRIAEYPNMKHFLKDMRYQAARGDKDAKGALAFYAWAKNDENRRVELLKERVRIYESAGEVRNEFVP